MFRDKYLNRDTEDLNLWHYTFECLGIPIQMCSVKDLKVSLKYLEFWFFGLKGLNGDVIIWNNYPKK